MEMDSGVGKFVMVIVAVAMTLTIGLLILGEFKTSIGTDISGTGYTNENLTWSNNTYVALTNQGFSSVCNQITNASVDVGESSLTVGTDVDNGNYSIICDANGVKVIAYTTSYLSPYMNVNYTVKVGNEQYNATGSNISKLGTVPTWIGILITVALAFIVMGYFYSRR